MVLYDELRHQEWLSPRKMLLPNTSDEIVHNDLPPHNMALLAGRDAGFCVNTEQLLHQIKY